MEAPRVNASMLPQYSGRLVCLVGNVTEVKCKNYSLVELNTRVEFDARSILDLDVNNICLSVNFVVNARV